jgi:hypothetical protein
LGGGGGTKLFCSQALNATHANSTNKLRDAVTPFCEREGIIPVPQSSYFKKQFYSEDQFRPSFHSNNPLAVEPETENDTAAN